MLGTTGRVARTTEVQDVKQRGSQTVVEGTHEETITEACIVVGELPDGKLRVVVFGSDGISHGRDVDAAEFTAAGGGRTPKGAAPSAPATTPAAPPAKS